MTRDLPSACAWDNLYSPHSHKLVDDFYEPVLLNTVRYDRVAGYFRSSVLTAVSCGYEGFCDHPNSKMRLIIGLEMTQDDHDRILFWNDREKVDEEIRRRIEEELSKEGMPSFEKSRLAGLSWMLDNDKLEVKFGVMLDDDTKEPIPWAWGKLHHKICYFEDEQEEENSAMISGSINETEAAWSRNGDSFSPWVSWEDGRSKNTVKDTEHLFDALWETEEIDEDLNVGIYHLTDIPDLWKSIVAPIQPSDTEPWPTGEGGSPGGGDFVEWTHKITAREFFLGDRDPSLSSAPMPAGKQGILCMATGTGKTMTALRIARQMLEEGDIDNIVITTLRKGVLEQWFKEINSPKQEIFQSLVDAQYRRYGGKNEGGKYMFSKARTKLLLTGKAGFEELIADSREGDLERTLLIVDECHNFRGEGHRSKMKGHYQKFPYRLGLSATPDSEYDDDANDFMFDEIGPLFFNYGLEEAILDRILCPFEYHWTWYTPDSETMGNIKKIMAQMQREKKENPRADLTMFYIRMAREYKRSKAKLGPITTLFEEDPSILDRCIIFGPEIEYNDYLVEFLNGMPEIRWDGYYGGTDRTQLDNYPEVTKTFLSCKALGEGVDLPVNNVVLVSSENTRLETIQRIGRSLRTHGDPNKVARIYDFIRDNDNDSSDTQRRDWLLDLSRIGLESKEEG